MWVQAEIIAMATDVAEFLGAALALNLLFHVPLVIAGVMTGFLAFGLLELQMHGFRRFELAITGLLGLIFLGFIYETFKIGPVRLGRGERARPAPRAAPSRCTSRSGSSAPPSCRTRSTCTRR